MIRWALNLVAVLSLLLLVAVLGLWVRGYWAADHFWLIYRDGGGDMLRSSRGQLTVRHVAPNVHRLPLPRRVSHWSCPPATQLAPAPSPLHWEKGPLVYEGTPGATAQEVAAARQALKEAEAGQLTAQEMPGPGVAPKLDPSDPESIRQYRTWLLRRELSEAELVVKLREAKAELFNLRVQGATGQLDNHRRLQVVRKDIAKIYTIMRERELGLSVAPDEVTAS